MKSLRLISLFAAIIVSSHLGIAQDNFLKDFAPVAPTPASLGKYGDIPVSYHTGLPNIDIPIYNFTEGSLSVPINLSYHASGIRVQETASWVGLGWALNAGGIITRTVQGSPDERGNNGQTWGWYSESGNGFNVPGCTGPIEVARGHIDTEPDIFNFNCGGFSGKFYYDKDRNIKLIPVQDVQIETFFQENPTRFLGWCLTTPDGTKYYFGTTSSSNYAAFVEKSTYTNDPFTTTKPSSWYLSKIESADGKDVINFSYVDEFYSFWEVSTMTNNLGFISTSNRCGGVFVGVRSPIWAKIDGKRLSSISSTNGSVLFIGESTGREDLNSYTYGSMANSDAKALKAIEIKRKDNTCLHKFDFAYTYWTSTNPGSPPNAYLPTFNGSTYDQHDLKRLVLTSLTESDCASSLNNKVHSFEYNGPNLLPRRLSFAQDHYGFYNGKLTNVDLKPGTPFMRTICCDPDWGNGAHNCTNPSKRAPKWPEMQYGTLNKINFPTGGNTNFEFEGHKIWGADTTCTTTFLGQTSASQWGGPNSITLTLNQTQINNGHVKVIAECGAGNSSVTVSANTSVSASCPSYPIVYKSLSSFNIVANTPYTFTLSASVGAGFLEIYTLNKTTVATNVLTGGIRIKKITTNDGDTDPTNNIVKFYDYAFSTTQSTGKLVHKPLYTGYMTICASSYDTTGVCANYNYSSPLVCPDTMLFQFNNPYTTCPSFNLNPTIALVSSSIGLQPMQTTQGNFIGYTLVKVSEANLGATYYSYNMGEYEYGPYFPSEFPFVPPPYEPMLGTLASVKRVDLNDNFVNTVDYQYISAKTLTDLGTVPGNWPMKCYATDPGGQNIRKYTLNSGYALISQEKERIYNSDGSTFQEKTTKYFYTPTNGHLQKTAEETTNSDNTTYKTQYKYALDYPCPSGTTCDEAASSNAEAKAIYAMRKRNLVALPIEQTTWIKKGAGSFQLTGATYFKFDKVSSSYNNIKLQEVHQLRTNTPITNFAPSTANASAFTKDSRYTREYNFTFSDAFGRLMTQWKEHDPAKQQYLWGHNNKLPVAKVINAETNGIAYTSFEEPVTVPEQGRWIVPSGGRATNTGEFQTGKTGYSIANGLVETIDNVPSYGGVGKYIVSFWLKGGSVNVKANTTLKGSATSPANTWVYWEIPVTQTSDLKINVSGTGIIDELRLHATGAQMRTFTYDDNNQNLLSITDENGISAHFDYDSWQRLQAVRDQDRNILQTYEYNYLIQPALNNVKALTVLKSGQTNMTMVNGLMNADVKKIVQYIDGLGRPIQTNAVGQSPAAKDIVAFNQYDQYGREPKAFIPYAVSATSNGVGGYILPATAVAEQATFATFFGSGGFGYSQTVFEASPLNRPLEQGAPGNVWKTGQGANAHTMRYTWRSNKSAAPYNDNVRNFSATGNFGDGLLWVNEDKGENGNLRWTYTDKMGRVALVKQELGISSTTGLMEYAQTYTVYDDFGRVAYVIPPMATAKMSTDNNWDPAHTNYAAMVYKYAYDARGRLISKTVPSAGTSTIAYDKLDRPVLTIDANTTTPFKLFTRYDILSRPVISGRYKGTASPAATDPLFESPNSTAPFNYTSSAFPVDNNIDIYKSIYYDDYDLNNDNTLGTGETYTNPAESGYETAAFMRTRGKPTASKTAILKNDNTAPTTYLTTLTFYDKEYSVIQINKQNHLSGTDISSNAYDFANRLISTRRDHTATPPGGTAQSQTIRETYTYDHASRIKFVRHKIGPATNPWKLTSAITYDELGRVKEKNLHMHNYDGTSNPASLLLPSPVPFLQSLDYSYNIRGWLIGINNPANCALSGNDQLADLFAMNLLYDAPTAGSGSAQYNGNISEMQWRTNTAACLTLQAYRFSYDKGNRLLAADHWTNPGTWTNTGNYSESGISYDLNGNLKGYIRNGLTTTANVFGTIDRLTYSYDPAKPDRLVQVKDISSKDKGFKFPAIGMPATPQYVYDDNGNMNNDKNKNLFITYNHLNLPTSFNMNGNLITMTYTADGEKLTKVAAATKNYVSGIEYTGANLEAIYTSEGRCKWTGTAFDYEYTIKDHLGNARVSFKTNAGASLTPIQENHYYPFGMEIEGLSTLAQVGTENAHQYNNKEFIEDFGLNLADYWARSFDATIGRWWTVDPLATHFGDKSGYNYVSNNPVAFIDPNGLWEERADGQAYSTDNLKEIKQYLKAVQNYSENGFSVVRGEGGKDGAVFQLSGVANDGRYTSTKFNNESGGKKAENPISIGNGGVKNEDSVVDRKAMEDWAAHERSKYGPWCPEVMGVGITVSGNIGKAAASASGGFAADNSSIGVYGGISAGVQASVGSPIGFSVSIDWFGGDRFGNPSGSALGQLGGNDILKSATLGPISLSSSSTAEYIQDEDGRSRLIPSKSGLQTLGLSIGVGTSLIDVGVNTSISKSGVKSINW